MNSQKDPEIQRLISRLALGVRGWKVVDYWEADDCAVGIEAGHAPRRVVYVSVYGRRPGRYDYSCEVPTGAAEDQYETIAEGSDVDFDTLRGIIEVHLR
jgi:hypothetical protein